MKILIDIGHPAHVHYFRNFIKIMEEKEHSFFIIARNKEVTQDLLKLYNISFASRGKGKNSLIGKLLYIIKADIIILNYARKFKPDLFLSFASPYAAHASWVVKKPHITFDDTEHAHMAHKLYAPFTDVIFSPKCFINPFSKKQILFDGFMELSYLRQKYFNPDKNISKYLGISENEKYAIIRFVSWNANHDIGQFGLDYATKQMIVKRLNEKLKVFISAEGLLPEEFEPYRIKIPVNRMHDVLAFAHLFVGEGATMASECAMLGTPAIYVNSLDAGTLQEQEKRGLIAGFRNSKGVIEKMEEWLSNENLHAEMKVKRNKMLDEMIDPTKMLVWFVENYPNSKKIMQENPDYQYRFK